MATPIDNMQWQRVTAILDAVLEQPGEVWSSILDTECAGDVALRREVESLLAHHTRANGLLEGDSSGLSAHLLADSPELFGDELQDDALLGAQLGAWRIVSRIGIGGMSRVYLGERADGEFEQRVAIKVLRAGLDSPADRERFRAERRILARLDHPLVARLLDGNVTPDGRPYLVLEYVEGEPVTKYASANQLTVQRRIALALELLDVLQFAHRRLVVHRDIKPSNVLVAPDGKPRVLDFGIAKLLDAEHDITGEPAHTQRQWLTLPYAAPEQLAGGAVSTATDVYQLGVLLYELFAGRRPFVEREHDRRDLERAIVNDDPLPPSRHDPEVSGDIDAVIFTALRKDPESRYSSVAEFAAEWRRVLANEPVLARSSDRWYRWRRGVRRNAGRLAVGTALLAAAAVYVGTIVTQNRRIGAALADATAERAKAEEVTAFLLQLFRDPNSGSMRSDTVSARTLLDRGASRASLLAARPEVQAAMLDAIGRARYEIGVLDESRESLNEALRLRSTLHEPTHPDVMRSQVALAQLHTASGNYALAESLYRAVLPNVRSMYGDTSLTTQLVLYYLATSSHAGNSDGDAPALFAEWEALVRRRIGTDVPNAEYAAQLDNVGQVLLVRGMRDSLAIDSAEFYLSESLRLRRLIYGDNHTEVAKGLRSLGDVHTRRQRFAIADSLYGAALTIQRNASPDHPHLAALLSGLAALRIRQQRPQDAVPMLREAIALTMPDSATNAGVLGAHTITLGRAFVATGELDAAERAMRDAVARFRRGMGDDNVMTLRAQVSLGDVLRLQKRYADAERVLRSAHATLKRTRNAGDPQVRVATDALARLLEETGRRAEARALAASAR